MTEQRYEIVITATGEVRDADGNLVETVPIEHRQILTAAEAAALTEGDPS